VDLKAYQHGLLKNILRYIPTEQILTASVCRKPCHKMNKLRVSSLKKLGFVSEMLQYLL